MIGLISDTGYGFNNGSEFEHLDDLTDNDEESETLQRCRSPPEKAVTPYNTVLIY